MDEFLGPAEEAMFELAGQDMPVSSVEVEDAMRDYKAEMLDGLLYMDMIEQHRPVVEQSTLVPNARTATCLACNGNVRITFLDEAPPCKYWTNAKRLGLVSDEVEDEVDSPDAN